MFEYICDHVVPGCPHKETGDTREAVREKALEHLHSHDGMEYIDDDVLSSVDGAIVEIHSR
jgi:predicted small metal-binding protein